MKAVIFLLAFIAMNVTAQESLDAWQALANCERRTTYGVVLRDGSCRRSRIDQVNATSIKIGPEVFQRENVLFAGESLTEHDVVYDTRNCWSSVLDVRTDKSERVRVLLKSGQDLRGSTVATGNGKVTLKLGAQTTVIAKDDVVQMDYIRFKPIRDDQQFSFDDVAYLIFLPRFWQFVLTSRPLMTVRIYDSRLAEDCTPLPRSCHR